MPQLFATRKDQNAEFENRVLGDGGPSSVSIERLHAAVAGGNRQEVKKAIESMHGNSDKEAYQAVIALVSPGSEYTKYGNADFKTRVGDMEIREAAIRAAYSIAKASPDGTMVAEVAAVASEVARAELAKEGFGSGTMNFLAHEPELAFLPIKTEIMGACVGNLGKHGKPNLPYEDFSDMEQSMRESMPAKQASAQINKQKTNRWIRKNSDIYRAVAQSTVAIKQNGRDAAISSKCDEMIVKIFDASKKGGSLDKLSDIAGQTAYNMIYQNGVRTETPVSEIATNALKDPSYKNLREGYEKQSKFRFSGVAMKIGQESVAGLYESWKAGHGEFQNALNAVEEKLKAGNGVDKTLTPQDRAEIEDRFKDAKMLGVKP